MIDRRQRGNAYLRAILDGRAILAAAMRDDSTTPRSKGVAIAARWWFALTAIVLGLSACRTSKHNDTYARGTQLQEECCEHLDGANRDACLREVVRVDDPGAAPTATNQQTYACVVEHFVCDPRTGREPPASAQAQHDCTDDIQ
ncbi:MAG TPA: hypothetical protein VM513_02725 [Kofleriaceae bacterium]|jgi:hypothetical protein|nr:hypothetical protein [Kofleriaceae bacterium]